jgi:TfoX/Sxy family transcriptional regulator of competence genes
MAYDEVLAERLRAELKSRRGLTETKMFGGVGFLVNGNMACGVIKQDLIVRLSHEDSDAALKQAHVKVFDMTGKPMKGWVLVAPDGVKTDRARQGWVDKAIRFARSLPPK